MTGVDLLLQLAAVALCFGPPALALLVLIVRTRRVRAALADRAAARGWRYHPTRGPVRWAVEGLADGRPWRLEHRRVVTNSEAGAVSSTVFEAPIAPDHALWLGPRPPIALTSDSALATFARETFLRMSPVGEWIARTEERTYDGRFGELFEVRAADDAASALLDEPLRARLLRFAETDRPPSVVCRDGTLTLRLPDATRDPDRMERIADLGAAILRRCRGPAPHTDPACASPSTALSPGTGGSSPPSRTPTTSPGSRGA